MSLSTRLAIFLHAAWLLLAIFRTYDTMQFMRKFAWVTFILLIGMGVVWLCLPKFDPRQMVLGDWREVSSKIRVEVGESQAAWRGAGRGALRYEWLQAENEPYRVRITHGRREVEANLTFSGDDEFILEPEIWEQLPPDAQSMLREINRRNGRQEREFRLLFRRNKKNER